MKKIFAAAALASVSATSALAADMPINASMYAKAPAAYWTGFYVYGGGGGGLWNADSGVVSTGTPGPFGDLGPAGAIIARDQRLGGSGWFGTVGIGYDRQVSPKWVIGAFADGQFGSIDGSLSEVNFSFEGREKLRTSYAVGGRVGYLVAPNVLTYVNAGYSGSEWSGTTQTRLFTNRAVGVPQLLTGSFHRDGWFIGGGVENNLSMFGISAPAWSMKTEYRSSFYNRVSLPTTFVAGNTLGGVPGTLVGDAVTFKPSTQTISTSLVYRFN